MLYTFGDYTLDTQRYELRHAGVQMKLQRQVFSMLAYLLQHRDHVVIRQELFEHLWPDQFVSDAALERCIAAVRRAVGDSGRAQRLIQTLHGVGYRFVAAVQEQSLDPLALQPHATPPPPSPPEVRAREPAEVPPSDRLLSALEAHAVRPAGTIPTPEPILQGEHRPVTVLCCALVDAAALADRVGLDALHHLQQQWLALAQGEVQRYEGTIQHVVGESFLALFGAPVAQEDHARRAVLAALGLQRRLREHRFDLVDVGVASAVSPQVRMGLHTGLVVIGSSGDTLRTLTAVIGEATHLATELQHLAPPGTILLSEAVMRLVEGEVRVERLGSVYVPGESKPVMTYKVLGRRPRLLSTAGRGERPLSRFVGRRRELLALRALLAQVENGQGQVVGIVGELGIGKSRLLYEFQHSLRETRGAYLEGRCFSYGHACPTDQCSTSSGTRAALLTPTAPRRLPRRCDRVCKSWVWPLRNTPRICCSCLDCRRERTA